MLLDQKVGNTVYLVINLKQLGQSGLADVETHEQYLLAQQCETDGEVGAVECLAFARSGGGEEDDLLVFLHHKLQVGTHRTEDFFHHIVLVLVYHDVGLGLGAIAGHSHVGDDGQLGELLHVVVSLNLVAQQLDKEEQTGGNTNAQYKRDEQYDATLRTDFAQYLGSVDELAFVHG